MPKLNPDKVAHDLARWHVRRDKLISQLGKAQDMIKRLEKSQRRLANKPLPVKPEYTSVNDAALVEAADMTVEEAVETLFNPPQDDELEIPSYLKREQPADSPLKPEIYEAAHAVANKHNAPPTPEQEKLVQAEKAKVKKEHKHALLTGQTRKWPKTGKDALDLIGGQS